ncbi:hypothetical protein MAM1_0036c02689 [Mucor ambiguus]|uniref:Dilute domain-containing protein n=1 Tax=Mucor ambiguus TaxID=91626 RepID=A0A0C9MJD0_9FUNG|nr:hypothetical protein MAM1_0036c02689 [Mucor ambiguus]
MDNTSKIAALKTSKPTIASRRPMLNSQRSMSVLSINTSATHHDLMRRNSSSTTTSNRHRSGIHASSTPPPPLPTSATNTQMSPEELSSKIADSFQQFSSMLSQLSTNTTSQQKHQHARNAAIAKSGMVTTPTAPVTPPPALPLLPSVKPTSVRHPPSSPLQSQSQQQKQQRSVEKPVKKKAKKPVALATASHEKTSRQEDEDEDAIEATKLVEIYSRYAVFNEHYNLDEIPLLHGNTRLRHRLLIKWFNRAASIGDVDTMKRMLATTDVNVDDTDDTKTGITALMYAAYFGHLQCLQLLLNHQMQKNMDIINQQDKKGWTALVWAVHGHQLDAVKILLDHGACKSIKTKQTRTVYQYPTLHAIKELLGEQKVHVPDATAIHTVPAPTLTPPPQPTELLESPTTPTPTTASIPHHDMYHQASADGYSHFLNHHQHTKAKLASSSVPITTNRPADSPKLTPPDFSQLLSITTPPKEQQQQRNKETSHTAMTQEEEEDLKQWEASVKSLSTFSWNQCLPDQMFVFSQDEMHYILDHALHVTDTKSLANKSALDNALWQPANIVFLSARFAHYCSSRDLLALLLSTTAVKLSRIIKATCRDTQGLAFWIANMCQLSSYLKKDPGLSISTIDTQETLSALISETYTYFITESQKRLEKILPAVMDYEPIHELNQVDFADDWQRFFRRSSHTLSNRKSIDVLFTINTATTNIPDSSERKYSLDAASLSSLDETVSTPQAMTLLLTELQRTLQSYHVPPAIVIQAMAQFFHYLSCEMFNRVLTYKKYLCRSKALQIRMNLSAFEDWVRMQKLPTSLNQSFEPLVQLLQLLQCLSQLDDVLLFSSTIQTFDKLNALQVKRCVQNYRYEVSESRLPDQVTELANQWVVDHQHHWRNQRKASIEIDERETRARPSSISSLNSLLTPTNKTMHELDSPTTNIPVPPPSSTEEEKRNSKYLLPFSVLETTALLQGWTNEQHKYLNENDIMLYSDIIYKEIKLKRQEEFNVLDKIFPTITEEWLYSIDK